MKYSSKVSYNRNVSRGRIRNFLKSHRTLKGTYWYVHGYVQVEAVDDRGILTLRGSNITPHYSDISELFCRASIAEYVGRKLPEKGTVLSLSNTQYFVLGDIVDGRYMVEAFVPHRHIVQKMQWPSPISRLLPISKRLAENIRRLSDALAHASEDVVLQRWQRAFPRFPTSNLVVRNAGSPDYQIGYWVDPSARQRNDAC